jgi:hypothetical protein
MIKTGFAAIKYLILMPAIFCVSKVWEDLNEKVGRAK